jgi:hypothetical protein
MSILQRIQVLARISPIKPRSHYTWHKYNGPPKTIVSRKGYRVGLMKGHKFGLRPAKSDPDKIRMIHESTGINKVYTLTKNHATRLINHSKRL